VATHVDRALALLRKCASDLGWTGDALAAHMGKDKSYISRVLNGEKPMTLEFLIALPDDLEAAWHSASAESFGRLVVEPVSGDLAVRNLVSGLFGVLAPSLPERASRMARASVVATVAARKVAR
jgi:transcriptional regulator with XRE-family HTH domain